MNDNLLAQLVSELSSISSAIDGLGYRVDALNEQIEILSNTQYKMMKEQNNILEMGIGQTLDNIRKSMS